MKFYLRWGLIALALLGSLIASYRMGYEAGLKDQGPDRRALVVVRTPPNGSGMSATWFDFKNPTDLEKFHKEEAKLKAAGANYYIAKGVAETSWSPEPDPRRINAHR